MTLTRCCSEKRILVPLIQGGELVYRHCGDQKVAAISCSECAYVGFQPPSEAELSHYYSEHYGKNSGDWYSMEADYQEAKVTKRASHVETIASKYLTEVSGLTTMEIGCAFGGTVMELRRRGLNAYGADLNSDAISQGRAGGNEFIFAEPAESVLRDKGESAHIVYAYHALEHIPDVHGFLNSIKTCLADQGVMEFHVPNGAYLKAWKQGFESWNWFAYPDHLHMFSPRSALCLAKTTGLELLDVTSRRCEEPVDWLRRWTGWTSENVPDILIDTMLEQAMLMDELTMTLCVSGSSLCDQYAQKIEETRQRCLQNGSIEKSLRTVR